jgi:exopolysaccharide production protein ExoQ
VAMMSGTLPESQGWQGFSVGTEMGKKPGNDGGLTSTKALSRFQYVMGVAYFLGTMGMFSGLGAAIGRDGISALFFVPLYGWLLGQFILGVIRHEPVPLKEALTVSVLLIMLAASAAHCYKPISSLGDVVMLAFDMLFGLWLVRYFRFVDFVRMFVLAAAIMFLVAMLIAPVAHDALIYHDPLERANVLGFANIKGLYPHKIHAGIYNGIAFVGALFLYKREGHRKYRWLAAAFGFCVAAAGSSVALVALVGGGALAYAISASLRRFGWPIIAYVLAWVLFLGAVVLLYDIYPTLMKMLGRDPTMTGRVPIWLYAIHSIQSHPLWGMGYGVYFDPDPNSPAQGLWRELVWYQPPSFHSGYLQILAEAGLLGGGGFFLLLFGALIKAARSGNHLVLWMMTILLIANSAAALFITHRSLLFVALIYIAFSPEIGRGVTARVPAVGEQASA